MILISNGLPPIPARPVKHGEEGLFAEIAELLPSYLDSADLDTDGKHSGSRKCLPVLADMMDWV